MKKQTINLFTLGLIFLLWFCLAFECKNGRDTNKLKRGTTTGGCGSSEELYKQKIREKQEYQYNQTYERVEINFTEFEIDSPIQWTNPYGRAVETTAYPVHTRYDVEVWGGKAGDINHVWEYKSLIYFYTDTHGECTYDVIEGAGGQKIR